MMPYRKSENGSIHLVITILILIGLVSALGYIVWTRVDSGNKTTNTKLDASSSNSSSLVDKVYSIINPLYSSESIKISKDIDGKASPYYKPSTLAYQISAIKGSSITIQDQVGDFDKIKETTGPIINRIEKYLMDNGFKKEISDPIAKYTGASAFCTMDLDTVEVSPKMLVCSDLSDYEAAIPIVKPLADAYKLANKISGSDEQNMTIGYPKISESKISGYSKAEMGTSNSASLFYKKGNGDWQYFVSTQNTLQCNQYNTVDIRNAFNGDECYDSDKSVMSTVK